MASTVERWQDICHLLNTDTDVHRNDGTVWRRTDGNGRDSLYRWNGNPTEDRIEFWNPDRNDEVRIVATVLPEPPDGSRIEFVCDTDLYGARRNDASSAAAGWRPDQGWLLYGETIPQSWTALWMRFGDALNGAVLLVPADTD